MKGLKIFALVVGILIALMALAAAVMLTPATQTWLANWTLARQPGLDGHVSRVDASLSQARLDDVRLVEDGVRVTAKTITASFSGWSFLSRKVLEVDRLDIAGLELDLHAQRADTVAPATRPPANIARGSPVAASPRPAFEGVLAQMKLPLDVRIGRLTAEGKVRLSDTRSVGFTLRGERLQPGDQGTIHWKLDFNDATESAPLVSAHSQGSAVVRIAADRRVESIRIEASAVAKGAGWPKDRVMLVASASQSGVDSDETFEVQAGFERDGAIEPFVTSTAVFGASRREFDGKWSLGINETHIRGLFTGLRLPEIAGRGDGRFTFNPVTGAARIEGDLQATLNRLERISPALSAVGSLQLQTGFEGGRTGDTAQLERLQLEVGDGAGRTFVRIDATQHASFDLATQRISFAKPDAELGRIVLESLPLAWAQPFLADFAIASGDLSLAMSIQAEPDGSRIRARSLKPLQLHTVTLRHGEKELLNRLSLSARPQIEYSAARILVEVEEFAASTPAGDALTGRFSADVANRSAAPALSFASQLQGVLTEAVLGALPFETGKLSVSSSADGRLEADRLQLQTAKLTIAREGGAQLAGLELQQPVTVNLEKSTLAAEKPSSAAARIQLREVPLAWGQAFLSDSQLAGVVSGVTFEALLSSADDLTITTTEPLDVRGAGASLGGKPLLRNVDVTADFTARKHDNGFTFAVRQLALREGGATLATLAATGEGSLNPKLTLSASGSLDADVAAAMRQPAAADFAGLTRGRLSTRFEATKNDAASMKAEIALRDLVARENGQPLGALELTIDARVNPDGSGTLRLPVALSNADRRSSLLLAGTFGRSRDGNAFLFSAEVEGDRIFTDDFIGLAAIAPDSQPNAAGDSPTTPDTEAFWAGVQGKLQLNLKQVIHGKGYAISNLRGSATVTPSRLMLEDLEGSMNNNPFTSDAVITFTAGNPKPYGLTASADISNFDVAALLRAANPKEKPALESKVNVVARANGDGGTLGQLLKNVYGRFEIEGSQGVLRALGRRTAAASAASTILGIAGILTESKTTSALAEVTSALSELRFDHFRMQIERGADLSFKLANIEFISPLMRTTGGGRLAHREGTAPQNQPMEIQLQFGAKGQLAQLLGRIGALGQTVDDRGYNLLQRSFTLGGTPAKPDSGALWTFLLREAAAAGAPALQDLLNRR